MDDQQQQPTPNNFQDGVTEIMMACEELRQPFKVEGVEVTAEMMANGRDDLDLILENLGGMHRQLQERWTNPDEQQLNTDLFQHCQLRVATVAQLVLERALNSPEPKLVVSSTADEAQQLLAKEVLGQERQTFQGSLARIAELNCILCLETKQEAKIPEFTATYVAQQRHALRERVKPSIARLVQERKDANVIERLPHSHVITTILGEASALVHPLLAWLFSLPLRTTEGEPNKLVEAIRTLCAGSVQTLNEQAQTLTKTVQDWFWEDRNVDHWMAQSNQVEEGQGGSDSANVDLAALDAMVEEMAFVCQVLARYQALIQDVPNNQTKTIEQELLPEWTWKYGTLERFLATQQWKSALRLATPVHIVLGTSIQVPSVVEDAQYLSTRALERAASTRSTQAIGTVAHSISSHVWGVDMTGGVHQALTDQIGCYVDPSKATPAPAPATSPKSSNNSSSFASALLGALDDDIGKAPSAPAPTSGPSSGGLFSSLVGGGDALQQIRINTDFCNLNGIQSASTACQSLVKFLDALLDSGDGENGEEQQQQQQPSMRNPMIELAREELSHYGDAYDKMLKAQVQNVIARYCGTLQDAPKRKNVPCIPLLRYYFLTEEFELDQSSFRVAEGDQRLEKDLMANLKEAPFLQQARDKSDALVLNQIRDDLTKILAELVLDCLLHAADPPKRFTDWGSLLLSKQVRMLQLYLAELQDKTDSAATHHTLESWERLSQVVTVLQLERPSDWTLYQSASALSADDLKSAMQLRVDFRQEAINSVVANMAGNAAPAENGK